MSTYPSQHDDRGSTAQAVLRTIKEILGQEGRFALHEPEFAGNEWQYVKECIDTGWVSSVGSYVDNIEKKLAEITGARYAVATVNGTAALHIGLILAGVQPGDEVLIPTLTFVATANAVAYIGATPHFVESDERRLGISVPALNDYLNDIAELKDGICINRLSGRPIRAIAPMHCFGHSVDMDPLMDLTKRWKIAVVEDAAEALGSTYKGRHCGTTGELGILSFNGNKVVTTGGGGAILTNDETLGKQAKHLTTTARAAHQWSFVHDQIGYNYRMPNINAALGCAQLEQLDGFINRKRRLAAKYIKAFTQIPGCSIVEEPTDCKSNYWLVTLILDDVSLPARDQLLEMLNNNGIMARPVWTLLHKLPMFADCPKMPLCNALSLEARLINLPSSPKLLGR